MRAETGDEATTLILEGELDLATVGIAEEAFESARSKDDGGLILDLRALQFIDSSGLRMVLMAAERCAEAGRRFAIANGPPQVDRVLKLTGAWDRLEILPEPPPSGKSTA